jgi:hypothetical protein
MAPALMPVVLQQTQPKVGPYFYQEWITKRKLKRLITEIVSLLAGKPESFHSDIAASSGGEFTEQSDFWKTPIRYMEVTIDLTTENETRIDRDYERELLETQRSELAASIAPAIYEAEEDLLDWDAHIETPPPPRRSGTIKVRFKYIGRSKPIPINDPWA